MNTRPVSGSVAFLPRRPVTMNASLGPHLGAPGHRHRAAGGELHPLARDVEQYLAESVGRDGGHHVARAAHEVVAARGEGRLVTHQGATEAVRQPGRPQPADGARRRGEAGTGVHRAGGECPAEAGHRREPGDDRQRQPPVEDAAQRAVERAVQHPVEDQRQGEQHDPRDADSQKPGHACRPPLTRR
ncbi:hypothetical protein H4N64_00450 [Streptomyces sp. PSKA01]|uniref:Uncharacterized protein n=1 Tax=Streptomyces cupreus TaxID=2759956 RepID=A0A7X1M735_9ACTN|nr:hypothetical protein [Streptomyces cupreus]